MTPVLAPNRTASEPDFPSALRERVERYFAGRSKKAEAVMRTKILAGFGLAALTYAALYLRPWSAWEFSAIYLAHGLTQLFLLLNIAHDGNHGAVFHNRRWAKLLNYTFDLFGISSYMWRILHNRGHHQNINIPGDDEDVLARGFLRFSPEVPRHPLHRMQHIYAWIVYGLSTFDYVILKDWLYFFGRGYKPILKMKHPVSEYFVLFGFKALYYTYMLVLPIFVLKQPWPVVVGVFVATHFVIGLIAQFIFQTTHIVENSYFPHGKSDYEVYVYHVLATTADYSTESRAADWLIGGLNHHVVHHLFPTVCHTHYPAITRIVRETAKEFGVNYRENRSLWQALGQHYRWLKRMGEPAAS
ncbi:MAG: acyl-CoA desaturase [Bryobacteraceae bacterium]|nr:acyl-CoA desaturase [Bryobacteraceae bacterium]